MRKFSKCVPEVSLKQLIIHIFMTVRKSFSRSQWKTAKPDWINDHKIKFPDAVKDLINKSDVILEIIDVRAINKTRNFELEKLVKSKEKMLIKIINKVDLINLNELKKNIELKDLEPYVLYSVKNKIGRHRLQEKIKVEVKKLKLPFLIARVGIIGYPNTGKSSIINSLVGGKRAKTSSESGFTKAIHKIRFSKNIVLLDSPGVIPETEDSNISLRDFKKHAQIGVRTYDKIKNPDLVVHELMKERPDVLQDYFHIKTEDSEDFLVKLSKKLNFLKKGGEVDINRAARIVIKTYQQGKIRREKTI